ncbi:hypothetical protein CORC01_08827 [Colletotrichum orchidophilum]|uniref:Uncharacterized protein n=1 Tax=Colletotrichum orchidophilum TaxID=1209926 RepID=A0A1G4B338_9PEZI|nr:uncharacterized protein CORC01_08827 [Colletotrichum orchidophilum]OHE95830.1 hypothetical protein CORC01_08827 [Colletotrichum orchidophilum]
MMRAKLEEIREVSQASALALALALLRRAEEKGGLWEKWEDGRIMDTPATLEPPVGTRLNQAKPGDMKDN